MPGNPVDEVMIHAYNGGVTTFENTTNLNCGRVWMVVAAAGAHAQHRQSALGSVDIGIV